MALDPSSLKVTELRAELSKRSLPTKGKKDELIARLKEALENDEDTEEADAPEDPATTEKVIDEKPETAVEQSAENAVVKSTENSSEETVEKPAEAIVEKSAEKVIETPKEETIQKSPVETTEKPKEEIVEKSIEEVNKKIENKVIEKPDEQLVEVSQEQTVTTSSESIKQVAEVSSAEEMVTDRNATKRKLSSDDAVDSEEKRPKVDTFTPGCSALYVKGFVRPLISRSVQELFGKYGKVKRFWMDFIKTHSYVIYETDEEANEAYNNINGIVFPQDTGKKLTAGKLTSEQAQELIDYEQAAASKHIRIEWEPLLEKVKAGESLPQSPGGNGNSVRAARSIGMGQIAKQLAQAAEPSSNASRQITITAPTSVPKERSLDDLFRKTEALPHLYYLPVSDEEASAKLKLIQNL